MIVAMAASGRHGPASLGLRCAWPHRRADLSYGYVEACGLRCNYHGWLFGADGKCLEQPYDDVANPAARYKDKITPRAYPVKTLGGLLWAYMGAQPAPLLPRRQPRRT